MVLRHRARRRATRRTCRSTTTRTPATRRKWLYEPDLSRQAFNDKTWQNGSGRITTQLTPRNKLNIFWDEQNVCAQLRERRQLRQRARPRPKATATAT